MQLCVVDGSYLAKPFDVSTEVGLGEDVLEVPGEGLAF